MLIAEKSINVANKALALIGLLVARTRFLRYDLRISVMCHRTPEGSVK